MLRSEAGECKGKGPRTMQRWLGFYSDEIKNKYNVTKIEVKTHYIVISSLGVLQKDTFSDFIKLVNYRGTGKRQIAKNWARRMVMQACRGSFEM
jgi:hypothetical protein